MINYVFGRPKTIFDQKKINVVTITYQIGRGKQTFIAQATVQHSHKKYVIKYFPLQYSQQKLLLYQLVQKISSKLNYSPPKQVAAIYNFKITSKSSKYFYLLMQMCQSNLQKQYEKQKNNVKLIFKDVISGLQFLHNHQIIHKNIKLSNILINKNVFLLSDFITLTKNQKKINNTFLFSAPQTQFQQYDILSDIFSLGVVFFILIDKMHRHPFLKNTYKHIKQQQQISKSQYYQILKQQPPISIQYQQKNQILVEVVMIMIQKQRQKRPSIQFLIDIAKQKQIFQNLEKFQKDKKIIRQINRQLDTFKHIYTTAQKLKRIQIKNECISLIYLICKRILIQNRNNLQQQMNKLQNKSEQRCKLDILFELFKQACYNNPLQKDLNKNAIMIQEIKFLFKQNKQKYKILIKNLILIMNIYKTFNQGKQIDYESVLKQFQKQQINQEQLKTLLIQNNIIVIPQKTYSFDQVRNQ